MKKLCESWCDEARAERRGEEADRIQNQKQEPHTKMWGTKTQGRAEQNRTEQKDIDEKTQKYMDRNARIHTLFAHVQKLQTDPGVPQTSSLTHHLLSLSACQSSP